MLGGRVIPPLRTVWQLLIVLEAVTAYLFDMRTGGGVGFIVVLIAAAIVIILAMRQWLAVAPTAKQIMAIDQANTVMSGENKGKAKAKAPPKPGEHGQGSVEDQQKRGVLPDLQDMKDGTDEHSKAVQDAMKQTGE